MGEREIDGGRKRFREREGEREKKNPFLIQSETFEKFLRQKICFFGTVNSFFYIFPQKFSQNLKFSKDGNKKTFWR